MSDAHLPSNQSSNPLCAHGRQAYERCRECERIYPAVTGAGFDWPGGQQEQRPSNPSKLGVPQRYKVQQDQGIYALKGCEDGDLVDWSAYAALQQENARLRQRLEEYEPRVGSREWMEAQLPP